MTKKIKKYVEGCDQYQKMKNRIEMPAGKPMPNTVPEKPWQHIYYGGLDNQVTVVARSQFLYGRCNCNHYKNHVEQRKSKHSIMGNEIVVDIVGSSMMDNKWGEMVGSFSFFQVVL